MELACSPHAFVSICHQVSVMTAISVNFNESGYSYQLLETSFHCAKTLICDSKLAIGMIGCLSLSLSLLALP